MLRITDSQTMRLERLVRAVYGCERFGVAFQEHWFRFRDKMTEVTLNILYNSSYISILKNTKYIKNNGL